MVPIEGTLRRSLGHGCDECRRWGVFLFAGKKESRVVGDHGRSRRG